MDINAAPHQLQIKYLQDITQMRIRLANRGNEDIFESSAKMVTQHRYLARIETDNLGTFEGRGVLVEGIATFVELHYATSQDNVLCTVNRRQQTGRP